MASTHIEKINLDRFPLWEKIKDKGYLSQVSMELTERCNNNCLHCYINLPADDEEAKEKEITFEEIKAIVDEATMMGCLSWHLTGGEPLLREDFSDIYLYLKKKGMRVTLFTNATLVNSEVARLFKKYPLENLEVSIYGLSKKSYEAITRNPGSFNAFKRGINLLKENRIPFTVKTAALPQNFHEIKKMRAFAQSLTGKPLGAVLKLNLGSRFNHASKRDSIKRLRLPPDKVIEVLRQDEERCRKDMERFCQKFLGPPGDDRLFICGAGVGGCHIDAYDNFQLCLLLRHPDCVYSLREGSFKEAWEKFIPRVREIRANNEKYQEKCEQCFLKSLCEQCPAWSWMEHGVLDEPAEYLCEIAHAEAVWLGLLKKGEKAWSVRWEMKSKDLLPYHLTFKIGGIPLSIQGDFALEKKTFAPKFELFRCDDGESGGITIHHHCGIPKIRDWGEKVYQRAPWMIYKTPSGYIYKMFVEGDDQSLLVAIFNKDHTESHIYKGKNYVKAFQKGNLTSLLCFPTDQILFARLLADRCGIILHGSGLIFKGKGYLFVGHSDAGKTTVVKLFKHQARILNDDRMIVRKEDGIFYLYGTPWHGEVSLVAPDRVPLKTILFLNQAEENRIERTEGLEAFKRLYGCTIKALVTELWIKNVLDICQALSREVPCYHLYFDKSEGVISAVANIR